MSVDPSQIPSPTPGVSVVSPSQTPVVTPNEIKESQAAPTSAEPATSQVLGLDAQSAQAAELAEIAQEVRKIRASQTRPTADSDPLTASGSQRRSNRPGDADVIVGASKNNALETVGPNLGLDVTGLQADNKLATEPEGIASDHSATIRKMQEIRRQTLELYEPAPSDSRRLNEAVRIELDARRKLEMDELMNKRGNDFGGAMINMNPSMAYQEVVKSGSDYNSSLTEDDEKNRRLPSGAVDSKPAGANAGAKISGSIERYAVSAQFVESTQADGTAKSLEEIKDNLRRLGALDRTKK